MDKITQQQLVATNLKYGSTAKSLKVLAFADLSAKALFLSGGGKDIKEITKKVAEIIGVNNVSDDLINSGLKELKENNKIIKKGDLYSLTDEETKKIKREAELSGNRLEEVVNGHFPQNIKKEAIITWFNEAIVDFFEYNGDEWIQSICKGFKKIPDKAKSIDEILNKSIKNHSLKSYSEELKNAFRGIIMSEKPDDQNYLTSVGYAMFSARLVAADIGADPIALEELRGGEFFVDTNFLIALQLDSHKFAASMEALGKALKIIGAKLVYIRETNDEYDRVMVGRRGEVKNLFNVYPDKTVIEANDDFIKSAVARGCRNAEDFDRFYGDISKIPTEVPSGPDITLLSFGDIIAEVEKSKKDTALKNSIQKYCRRLRPFWWKPKSNSAIEHDAALIYVAELERRLGRKAFILTLDRGLQSCCLERAGSHNIPCGIYLEGLLQILAAYNAGPEIDVTNFAPLLSNILQKRCIPPEQTYSLLDLHWIYGIQKNVAQFSPEKIKEIALEVTRFRLEGRDASDEKLQRTVNRFYQEEIKNNNQKVEELSNRAREAEIVAQEEKDKRIEVEDKLNKQNRKEELRRLRRVLRNTCLWRVPLSILLIFLAYYLIALSIPAEGKEIMSFVLNVIQIIAIPFGLLFKPIEEYRSAKKLLPEV